MLNNPKFEMTVNSSKKSFDRFFARYTSIIALFDFID